MRSEPTIYCLVLYDDFELTSSAWLKWITFAQSIFRLADLAISHMSFKGEASKGEKYVTYPRTISNLMRQLEERNPVEWVSLMYLPDDYNQAIFDFHLNLNARHDQRGIYARKEVIESIGLPRLHKQVEQYHPLEKYLEAEASRPESLFTLTRGLADASDYESLKIFNDTRSGK
ncbi:hypothetical protein AB1L30_00820 [Bremerella sp. JC817]|uniref:hypothetical protein n=1 Tax=Bremerella sp. JC817 TaxID=3231756 RepID=UPI003457B7A6